MANAKTEMYQLQLKTLSSAKGLYHTFVPNIADLSLKVAIQNGLSEKEAYELKERIASNEKQLSSSSVPSRRTAHFHACLVRNIAIRMQVRNLNCESIVKALSAIYKLNDFTMSLTGDFENREELELQTRLLSSVLDDLMKAQAELKKELGQKPSPTT